MEKPILFNTEMAGAILEGRKTCTRRIVKPQPAGQLYPLPKDSCYPGCWGCNESNAVIRAPYQPGDILYVREAWRVAEAWNGSSRGCRIEYKAGGEETFDDIIRLPDKEGKWKPSIHLPKAAARIFLRVKSVRVERLRDIKEEQAKLEGVNGYWAKPHQDTPPFIGVSKLVGERLCHTRVEAFKQIWDSTVRPDDRAVCGWEGNPWVWVIEFEKIRKEEACED